jgi:hypothetical protein
VNLAQHRLKVARFLAEQPAHVVAWSCARPAERDDVLNLGQRQTEPPALLNEAQNSQNIRTVYAVSGAGSAWRRQNTARLVQSQSLPADAAASRHLTGRHGNHRKPCPLGPGQASVYVISREFPNPVPKLSRRRD